MVRAAWTARGCPLPGWDDLLGPAAMPDDADFAQVTALLARGALGRELLGGAGLPPQSAAAASAAALLDGEPSLVLSPAALRHSPGHCGGARVARPRLLRDGRESGVAGSRPPGEGEAPAVPPPPADGAGRQRATAPQAASAPLTADATTDSAATAPARGVATEFGGLPYLLHLVDRCGLPERAAHGELAGTGLVRLLYETGLRILGRLLGPARRPTARMPRWRACAGGRRKPAGRRPSAAGSLSPQLSQAADAEAERLIAALRAAVEPSWLAGAPEQDLLAAVCRRRGRIVADPGWIDVHLDLAEVSTDVRRAGLDLDLGYLPWLGCVVRFVYG